MGYVTTFEYHHLSEEGLTLYLGQTEGCGIGSLSSPKDIFPGSSGVLLPGVRIRLRDDDGRIVEGLEEMGEIEIESPSGLLGYVDHAEEALLPPTGDEEFWWPTGDVGLFRTSPNGEQHLFIVDRIRDMIKVKVSERESRGIPTCASMAIIDAHCVGQSGRSRPD